MEMQKAKQPVLAKEELDEHIRKMCGKFRRIEEACENGLLSEAERERRISTEIREGFLRYLESRGLECLPHIQKNWHRFLEDRAAFLQKQAPDSRTEAPWLRYRDKTADGAVFEADTADKAGFFRMMEAFRIPAEFFRP